MTGKKMLGTNLTRRDFIRLSSVGASALVLSACAQAAPTAIPATAVPPTAVPPTAASDAALTEPKVLVGDVVDYALKGDWEGRFGFVKFKLHPGWVNGSQVYFIRTDTSNKQFADENKLVFVPLLQNGMKNADAVSNLYLFDGGAPDQATVLSTDPAQANYSPLWRIHRVKPKDTTRYDSEKKIQDAAAKGDVAIETTDIFVNYPIVKWAGGEMSVDKDKKEYLGTGQLIEPVDTEKMTVTFKLHECFPGSRYIVTDTSAAPMAPMMAVAASSPTQKLANTSANATDKIWVWANGVKGSGVMGFQPAIFAHRAGDPLWSPFWNHFTLKWQDGKTPRVLKSAADIQAALAAGELQEFNGTPDTHPNGFVVNCPVPVLAPNTFSG